MKKPSGGVLLAGGGTAGHVFPGLELARRLIDFGSDRDEIRFTGTPKGSGADIIEEAGFDFHPIEGSGLSRSNPLINLKVAWQFLRGTARSVSLIRTHRPAAVVGLGGYASLPPLVAAWVLRVPRTILQEDATLGISNRIAARLCKRVAVAFPAPAGILGKKGIRVRPAVRESISTLAVRNDRERARREMDLPPDGDVVLFVGGSLGAGPINEAAIASVERWLKRSDITVVHVCGKRYYEECAARRDAMGKQGHNITYRLISFEPRFDQLLEAATLAVTRGGATTVGELAASGTPAIVVPSSYVVANHQEPNARALEKAGGCEVVLDADAPRITEVIESLLESEEILKSMRAAGPRACEAALDLADVVAGLGVNR